MEDRWVWLLQLSRSVGFSLMTQLDLKTVNLKPHHFFTSFLLQGTKTTWLCIHFQCGRASTVRYEIYDWVVIIQKNNELMNIANEWIWKLRLLLYLLSAFYYRIWITQSTCNNKTLTNLGRRNSLHIIPKNSCA